MAPYLLPLLLLLPTFTTAESLYAKSSPVLSIDSSTYASLIAKSNYTSILEFYAPWCGHCQNLKPAYEKAAKSLSGLAKVAAVNCDDESNKSLCASMRVQGFPTLKIVRPGKKGRPVVEDYAGPRTAKGIVDAVVDKIPNHVKRLKDGDYEAWLEASEGPKAILFSEKGTVSALLKSLAIEFLGGIDVAMIRDKEKEAVEVFGVKKFPTLVLLPGGDAEPVVYDGEMKKESMVKFLSQAATPNPDPAPKEKKTKTSGDKKKASKASAKDKAKKASEAKASQTAETIVEDNQASPSPDPQVDTQKPIAIPTIEAIPTLADGLTLQQKCLSIASKTCILAILPPSLGTTTEDPAISILSEIHHKHTHAKRNLFPFYQIPSSNTQSSALMSALKIADDGKVVILAINGKKGWWNQYAKDTVSLKEVDDWIDGIRMGDAKREKVPGGVLVDLESLPEEIPVVLEKKVAGEAEGEKGQGDGIGEELDFKIQGMEGMDVKLEEISEEELERITKDGWEAWREGRKEGGKKEAEKEEKQEKEEVKNGKEKGAGECPMGHGKKKAKKDTKEEGHEEL